MFGTAVGSGKQRVLATELDSTDRSFDRIVVEFDTAVINEARQPLPAREGVADGLGDAVASSSWSHARSCRITTAEQASIR